MEKKELIDLLNECDAIKFGHFVLTSGKVSNYYIDIKNAITNPKVLKKIAEKMIKYTKNYDLLAGMELGAVPIIVALSLKTNIPYIIIRKEKRVHGTRKKIEGSNINGKKILLIEDVTTSGSSVLKSIKLIRENKGIVNKVIVVVDRESGTKGKLKDLDVNFIPLLSVSDILKNSVKLNI